MLTVKNYSVRRRCFLLEELETLQSEKIIDAATAGKISEYYSLETANLYRKGVRSYFLLALVLIGSLLISAGVVLLFAYNWDMLPKYQRIGLSFVPFVLSVFFGAYTLAKDKDIRFREFAALFSSASFAVLIALISHIYNINGSIADFAKLLLLFSLPIVYIFKSHSLAVLYCLGLFALNTNIRYETDYSYLLKLIYLAAIIPYICRAALNEKDSRGVLMSAATVLPLVVFAVMGDFAVNLPLIISLLIAGGIIYKNKEFSAVYSVWYGAGWISFTIYMLFVCQSQRAWEAIAAADFVSSNAPVVYNWLWLLPIVLILFAVRYLKSPFHKAVILGLPFLTMAGFFDLLPARLLFWAANWYLIFVGFHNLIEGLKTKKMTDINVGIVQLTLFITAKFYDADLSILGRAVVFITAGVVIIALNIFLSRRFANNDAEESKKGLM